MLHARIDEYDHSRRQTLADHSRSTSQLCSQNAAAIGFMKTGELIGLLHDMGKASPEWQAYLEAKVTGSAKYKEIFHSPVGAIYAYEKWYLTADSEAKKLTAQFIIMTIYGHHSGLCDVLSGVGKSQLLDNLTQDKRKLYYDEAVCGWLNEVSDERVIDELFKAAVSETEGFMSSGSSDRFSLGLVLRFLLSCLIDADRLDSACFEYKRDPFEAKREPDWKSALTALENKLNGYEQDTPIAKTRRAVSDMCADAGAQERGIYSLTVPTGGGKTFSSLRFALTHASQHCIKHIYYVIPYNTILEQNADEISKALGASVYILEHHSNVVIEDESELAEHIRLTERWDSDIILTSMVQFLNSIYNASNTDARRMRSLADSVIIFDEIQSLPHKCTELFEKAVRFLSERCGCTIVLCTATQPQLNVKSTEIITDVDALFKSLTRIRIIDETRIHRTYEEAARDLYDLAQKHGAVIIVVNTKRSAHELISLLKESDAECVCLTTNLHAEHRLRNIKRIKQATKEKDRARPFICVATALIEAGVNISFPCVVRVQAGLGNALQTGGRCNRNGELEDGQLGMVYIWDLKDESLNKLEDIEKAQDCLRDILFRFRKRELNAPDAINAYYELERRKFDDVLAYPCEPSSLVDLLGDNSYLLNDTQIVPKKLFPITAAFRTAEGKFKVIDADTVSVLVELGAGAEIAAELASRSDFDERKKLLREAQRYSVSLYRNVYKALCENGGIYPIESVGVYVLRSEHYDENIGVTIDGKPMELLDY